MHLAACELEDCVAGLGALDLAECACAAALTPYSTLRALMADGADGLGLSILTTRRELQLTYR